MNELEDGYPSEVRVIVKTIKTEHEKAKAKWYGDPAGLAADMRHPSAHNQAIYDLLESFEGSYLRIKVTQLVAAQIALKKRCDHEAREQARLADKAARAEAQGADKAAREKAQAADKAARDEAKRQEKEARSQQKANAAQQHKMETCDILQQELGGVPANEREFVTLKLARDGITMSFDRRFAAANGKSLTAEQVDLDLHLTAADLALVKPRGDHLAATNISRAFCEWAIGRRQECVRMVCDRVAALPPEKDRDGVTQALEHVCGLYFREPLFACAAIRKMIWQIKRMLLNVPVPQRHMFVFVGEQNSGKTFLQRLITSVIKELVAEASLKDVLDERQMELPQYGAILIDEMVGGDRADTASLKNFVTGQDWARRPMRSNMIEKVTLRATLLGTSNHSLGVFIFDNTGMRRFVEMYVLPRVEIEPNWQSIIDFDWLAAWQSVDINEADPLLEYQDVLSAKQEELRTANNTEQWLDQFYPSKHNCKEATNEFIEYWAQELYHDFKLWEEQFDRGWRGTSISKWGREMKALIDGGKVPHWRRDKSGPKTVYTVTLSAEDQPSNNPVTNLRRIWSRDSI